ncbi:hypothetical protein HXX76_011082 [Chlamydomonas incerta]|uniref:Uncharacterized protein n=1 Tax=Chlamydomonas incerta TaxID=51695 RepID=A0A835VXL7_CHLIN|nr:hypothetical protein HXX76_011082 [Chlamydomonas incerta]|eukprot:KAG2429314.1 hypothetical protein HXX76_011082 [Chlamydomonas incerta]
MASPTVDGAFVTIAAQLDAALEDLWMAKEQPHRVVILGMRLYSRWLASIPDDATALRFLISPPVTVPGETGSESQRVAHRRLFTLASVIKYTPGLRAQQAWLRAMAELCGGGRGPGGRRWVALILRQLLPAAASSPTSLWVAKTRQLLDTLRQLFQAEGVGDGSGGGGFEEAMADTYGRMRQQAALCADAAERLRQLDWLLNGSGLAREVLQVPVPVAPAA